MLQTRFMAKWQLENLWSFEFCVFLSVGRSNLSHLFTVGQSGFVNWSVVESFGWCTRYPFYRNIPVTLVFSLIEFDKSKKTLWFWRESAIRCVLCSHEGVLFRKGAMMISLGWSYPTKYQSALNHPCHPCHSCHPKPCSNSSVMGLQVSVVFLLTRAIADKPSSKQTPGLSTCRNIQNGNVSAMVHHDTFDSKWSRN